MRSLEEVLKDLNDAEKEFKEKCDKYGIEEKHKRKPKEEVPQDGQIPQDSENSEEISQ